MRQPWSVLKNVRSYIPKEVLDSLEKEVEKLEERATTLKAQADILSTMSAAYREEAYRLVEKANQDFAWKEEELVRYCAKCGEKQ